MNLFTKILLLIAVINANYQIHVGRFHNCHLILEKNIIFFFKIKDAVYCYVCTEMNPACGNPPNLAALAGNMEPCNGGLF
jgi:hypothetical protein